MRYIVTGATGIIGQSILEEIIKSKDQATVIVRPNSKRNQNLPQNESIVYIPCDISNIENLKLNDHDVFIHLAWQGTTGIDRQNKELQQTNIKNSINALRLAEKSHCNSFFFAGSQAEYGNILEQGYYEQTELNKAVPKNEYGRAKLAFSKILEKYSKNTNMFIYHGRIFSVYGPKDQPNSLVNLMLQNLTKKDGYMALGPCEHDWNFTFSEDIAKLILNLTSSKAPSGIYNLASHDTRPLKEFVNTILFMKDWSGVCQIGARQSNPASDIPLRPNIKKLEQYVQIEETPFVIGMQKTIEENYNLQLKKSDKITGSVGRTK